MAAVEDGDGQWGFIDKKGAWVINPQLGDAQEFLACGIAPVKEDGSRDWGGVDKTGKYIINPQFRAMYSYGAEDKFLVMDQSGKLGVIDAHGKYIIGPDYGASMELLRNQSGIGAKYKAQSDYVDVESLAELIDAEIHTLKSTTTGGLKNIYGLKDTSFPKGGGDITIYKKSATPEMTFKLVVAAVDAWSKTSDGWFGYNYNFKPDIPIVGYILSVEFNGKGKAWRFVDEIFDVLKRKYPYDESQGTLSVPGYPLVFAAPITNGGIIISVKTESE